MWCRAGPHLPSAFLLKIKQPSAKCHYRWGCLGFLSTGGSLGPEGLGTLSLPLSGAGAPEPFHPCNRNAPNEPSSTPSCWGGSPFWPLGYVR